MPKRTKQRHAVVLYYDTKKDAELAAATIGLGMVGQLDAPPERVRMNSDRMFFAILRKPDAISLGAPNEARP